MKGLRLTQPLLIAVLLAVSGCTAPPAVEKKPAPVITKAQVIIKAPVRGIWLATVGGLDWPPPASLKASSASERINMQKQALIDALDQMVKTGINTVFFQVKPDASALWNSDILPWSEVLTGTLGRDPGYDPLAFMLEQAHRRGIKVHAWLNPYRVSMNTHAKTVTALTRTLLSSKASVFAVHPDWIRTASDRFVLDPGLPEVRSWIRNLVSELVERYDVDGVQFDDYFYYETTDSLLDDKSTFEKYGRHFSNKADWRRNNTLVMITEVSSAIKTIRPDSEFGISPAGVWRNKSDDPQGSATQSGIPSYDSAYADTRQWIKLGLLDYIAPQLYWPFDRKVARYDVLAKWWSEAVRTTPARLYIGVALYKIGTDSKMEPDWTIQGGVPELQRQLDLNENLPGIDGTILFRQGFLNQPQTQRAVDYLRHRWNDQPDGLLN